MKSAKFDFYVFQGTAATHLRRGG